MRVGSAWNDVSIVDISSRGLALHTADPPPRGSYLEVRRGRHVIVARVVWAEQQRLGVLSQDPLAVDAIISEPDSAKARAAADSVEPVERRRSTRTPERAHERSRHRARLMQFAVLTLFGAVAAFFAFEAVHSALSTSLAKVEVALASS
jgi:hypothetical protein